MICTTFTLEATISNIFRLFLNSEEKNIAKPVQQSQSPPAFLKIYKLQTYQIKQNVETNVQ